MPMTEEKIGTAGAPPPPPAEELDETPAEALEETPPARAPANIVDPAAGRWQVVARVVTVTRDGIEADGTNVTLAVADSILDLAALADAADRLPSVTQVAIMRRASHDGARFAPTELAKLVLAAANTR